MTASALLLWSPEAAARFEYVPPAPEAPRPSLARPAPATPSPSGAPLGDAVEALAPDGTWILLDNQLDPRRPTSRAYPDLRSLLEGEGLAAERDGEALKVGPAAAAPAPVPVWEVRRGELLRDTLGRWSDRAGVEVVWLTDRRWRLEAGRSYRGAYGSVVQALLWGLSGQPQAPVGELSGTGRGRVLTMLHRPGGTGRPDR